MLEIKAAKVPNFPDMPKVLAYNFLLIFRHFLPPFIWWSRENFVSL